MVSSKSKLSALNLPDERNPNATAIDISDDTYSVEGMDFIIHNMYADKGFITFRKWFSDDADTMLKRVASHVEQKLYTVISMQLSKHSCAIVCASDKDIEEWPEGALTG